MSENQVEQKNKLLFCRRQSFSRGFVLDNRQSYSRATICVGIFMNQQDIFEVAPTFVVDSICLVLFPHRGCSIYIEANLLFVLRRERHFGGKHWLTPNRKYPKKDTNRDCSRFHGSPTEPRTKIATQRLRFRIMLAASL